MPYRETNGENTIDRMVELNTKVYWSIYDDQAPSHWSVAGSTLVPDHDYRLRLAIKNSGVDVHLDRIQLRIAAKPGKMQLFDPGFTNPRSRVQVEFNDVPPNRWRGTSIHMRVLEQSSHEELLTVGAFGIVRPEGDTWSGWIDWPDDRVEDNWQFNP